MSISVITNFKVNAYTPIDSRLVATNSAALNEIQYPYEGLTVFTKDRNLNYTYNGSAWQVSSNGIYGGSGSMVGSTDLPVKDTVGRIYYTEVTKAWGSKYLGWTTQLNGVDLYV